jgi:hypothetical protein
MILIGMFDSPFVRRAAVSNFVLIWLSGLTIAVSSALSAMIADGGLPA